MIIGRYSELKNNNIKIGDTIWACAYEYTSTKEQKGLHQKPIFGMITHVKYSDMHAKYSDASLYGAKYFIPFKKDAKSFDISNLAWTKAVSIYSRQYATNELDCRNLYNQLIQRNIDWHTREIQKLKDDFIR